MRKSEGRTRVTFANVTACLALVVALGGTAHATGLIGGEDVRNGSLTGEDVANGSLTGKDLKNENLSGVDVRDGSLAKADLEPGVLPPLPGGNLPPGSALRGVFSPNAGTQVQGSTSASQGVTFAYPLAAAPRAHIVLPGSDPISECPGTLAAPDAAAGHLCVYVRYVYASAFQMFVTDVETLVNGVSRNFQNDSGEILFGDGKVSRLGFRAAIISTSNVGQIEGTWAVRAG